MGKDTESAAVACRLAAADLRDRLASIEELNAESLRDYRREGTRIVLTYNPSAAARVREFVRCEQECCPFLEFNIREEEGAFIVVIDAPEDAGDAADALFVAYTATRDATGGLAT